MWPFAIAILILPQIGRLLGRYLLSHQILVLGLSVVCLGTSKVFAIVVVNPNAVGGGPVIIDYRKTSQGGLIFTKHSRTDARTHHSARMVPPDRFRGNSRSERWSGATESQTTLAVEEEER